MTEKKKDNGLYVKYDKCSGGGVVPILVSLPPPKKKIYTTSSDNQNPACCRLSKDKNIYVLSSFLVSPELKIKELNNDIILIFINNIDNVDNI